MIPLYIFSKHDKSNVLTTFVQEIDASIFSRCKMTESLHNNVAMNINDRFECVIIATLSFFKDKSFEIVCSEADFHSNLLPNNPRNWRNNIGGLNVGGIEYRVASYRVQLNDQRFNVHLMYNSDDRTTTVNLMVS